MITLRINGQDVRVTNGTTVLEAARQVGIDIPTLCYLKTVGPYGACRLCVVEAKGPRLLPSILPSCNLPVSEGLDVTTHSPVIQSTRKIIVELLAAGTVMTPPLEEQARKFGVGISRFEMGKKDPCFLCGLCVRVCRYRIGASALSFAGSIHNTQVVAERIHLDKHACIGCGTCANICPSQAIKLDDQGFERRISLYGEFICSVELTGCEICGALHTTHKLIISILSNLDADQKNGFRNICPECARNFYAKALTGQFPSDGKRFQ
ncbi:MAG: 2Fe-2S iron-sulfur cluster-binding protein [Dissulfurispiraceae bacterium]